MWTPIEAKDTFVPPEVKGTFVPKEVKDQPNRSSVGQNAIADLNDLKTGGSALAANIMKPFQALLTGGPKKMASTVKGQVETVVPAIPEMGRQILENIKREIKHPINSFHDHPINTSLDALAAVDVLGSVARGGMKLVGEGARLAGEETVVNSVRHVLDGAPSMLPAGNSMVKQTMSTNPIIQMAQRALIKTSQKVPGVSDVLSMPGMRGLMPPGAITEDARMSLQAGKTVGRATLEATAEYNKNIQNISKHIGSLKEDEKNAFTAVVEGRAVPFKMSRPFQDSLDYYKSKVLSEAQKFQLPEETAKRVAYQPLVLATKGLYDEPLAAKVDVMGEAKRGNISAIRRVYEDAARGDEGARHTVQSWHGEVEASRIKQAEDGVREFLTGGKKKVTPEMKKIIRNTAADIAKELTPEPIYFPHVFEQKLKISDFIRLPTGLQKFRPGFLKVRAGADGYIETNPAYALMVHEKQLQKFRSTEQLVNAVIDKFAVPLKDASDLKPGHKVFAPEGAFKFYRTYLNFQDQFMKGVSIHKDLDQAYLDAAKNIMQSEVPNDRFVVGVRRAPMYQLPKAVADKLGDELKTYNWPASIAPVMKLIYDKPLDAFRYTVLGFRPGWVLHTTAGQVVTSSLSRVNLPTAMIRAAVPKMQEAMEPVSEMIEASGFRRSEMRLQGASRLQKANPLEHAAGIAGEILFSNEPVMESKASEVTRKILTSPIRAAKGFADGVFEANSRIEDLFRKAVAGDAARKMAVEQASRETAKSFFDARSTWDRFMGQGEFTEDKIVNRMGKLAKNPETRQEILDKTFKVLNNYAGLNSFERGVVRRVVPFWSWWKFVNTFAVRTAFQDPIMADLGRQLSAFGNDIEAQEWKQNGLSIDEIPLWKRGGTVVGTKENHGKVFEVMSGRNPNPFMTMGMERINLAPGIRLVMDLILGKDSRTGEAFKDPNTIEVRGRLFDRIAKRQVREAKQGATPDIPSELVRRLVPPASELEQAIHSYQFYPTDKLLGKHHPIPDERGHAEMVPVANRLAGLMGMPISDFKKISAMRDKQAQIMAIKAFLKRDVLQKRAQKEIDSK